MDAIEEDCLDRLLYFERERKFAEAIHLLDPRDADNLIRWASALFQLSRAQLDDTKSIELKKDAISKLDKALSLNSENHYILWCLGNVYCSLAKSPCSPAKSAKSYTVDDTSMMYFGKGYGYFKKALDKDPENTLYLESIPMLEQNFRDYLKEMSDNNKDPENTLYLKYNQKWRHYLKEMSNQKWRHYLKEMSDNNKAPEPHMETHNNGLCRVGESSGSSNPKAAKNPKSSNLMYWPYGLLGGVVLAGGIYALKHIAKSPVSPPPPR